jgi:hypothetical protein
VLEREKADMVMRIKILKPGDEVLNVWSNNLTKYVAVKHKNGDVSIYSISDDERGIARVYKNDTLIITKGNGEVTTEIPVISHELSDDDQKNGVNSTVQITSF